MKCFLVFLVALFSEGVITAPVIPTMEGSGLEGSGCSTLHSCNVSFNETLFTQEDLKTALMNNSENLERIRSAFTLELDEVNLCISVNYIISCTDQSLCQLAELNCTENNCSIWFAWTSFDTHSLSGSFLFYFAGLHASLLLQIPGFDWGGACDMTHNTLQLDIETPSLLLHDNWEEFFNTLTKQVSDLRCLRY